MEFLLFGNYFGRYAHPFGAAHAGAAEFHD